MDLNAMADSNPESNRFMVKVYAWMFIGLLVSAASSVLVYTIPILQTLIFGNIFVFYGLIIFQLLIVGALIVFIKRIPSILGILVFIFYCFLTGLTLSAIFFVYTLDSILYVFVISAMMFGFMSLLGYFTKMNLSGIGNFLYMGLFGVIIASLLNIFFVHNDLFDFALTILGVIIFTGLAATDTQKIKNMNVLGNEGTDEDRKESVMGALTLYLDFINLFLNMLRLFGKRRN